MMEYMTRNLEITALVRGEFWESARVERDGSKKGLRRNLGITRWKSKEEVAGVYVHGSSRESSGSRVTGCRLD
jgi:hypothetical protein